MATTTISEGYVYITNGSVNQNTITTTGSQKVVKLYCGGNVTENGTNDIFFTPIPTTNKDNLDPKILDLGKVKEAVTVTGFLRSVEGGVKEIIAESNVTALEQRDNLRALCKGEQPVTLVWGTYNATKTNQTSHADFNINKWQFKFVPTTPFARWSGSVVVWNKIEVTIQGLLGSTMLG